LVDFKEDFMNTWNGFKEEEFEFEGRRATVVFPEVANEGRFWSMKMVYKDPFPNTEIALLKAGFHVVYFDINCRWANDKDNDARNRFCDFIIEKYDLNKRFCPIGMSAGGSHSISFASRFPDRIAAMFLDAPVVDFTSCPSNYPEWMEKEFYPNFKERTEEEIKNSPENPLNRLPELVKYKIPLILLYGDKDEVVIYEENGLHLYNAYVNADAPIKLIVRTGEGHHPHGLEDPSVIVDFLIKGYRE
jgi:pimeloyl-ACP methyl ester carboxylesterase